MTYILASHCSDGVVIVADRKIRYEGETEFENKIFELFILILSHSIELPLHWSAIFYEILHVLYVLEPRF
jgi:hypothetical protein